MDPLQPHLRPLRRHRAASVLLAFLAIAWLAGCRVHERPLEGTVPYERTLERAARQAEASRPSRGSFQFGVANVSLDPPLGAPLAGYGNRASAPAIGFLEPIRARAIAFSDGTDTAVLVSADLLIINEPLEREVMRRLRQRRPGVRSEQIFLCATHTHSGPGGYGRLALEQLVMGKHREGMLGHLAEGIAAAADAAWSDLSPGELALASTWVPEAISNRVGESGRVNAVLDVIACRRMDGPPAWVLTYSAHPTVLPSENLYFSGDYPASACRELEVDGGVALFAPGTVGGQRPSRAGRERLDACGWIGHLLARRAREAIAFARWREEVDLCAIEVSVDLPPSQVRVLPFGVLVKLPSWLGQPVVPKKRSQVQLLALDRRVLYGTPCDLGWDVGEALGAEASRRGFELTAISHTEGYVGYCCREARFWRGGYEAQMSFFGPHMDQYFRDLLSTVLDHLSVAPPVPAPRLTDSVTLEMPPESR